MSIVMLIVGAVVASVAYDLVGIAVAVVAAMRGVRPYKEGYDATLVAVIVAGVVASAATLTILTGWPLWLATLSAIALLGIRTAWSVATKGRRPSWP